MCQHTDNISWGRSRREAWPLAQHASLRLLKRAACSLLSSFFCSGLRVGITRSARVGVPRVNGPRRSGRRGMLDRWGACTFALCHFFFQTLILWSACVANVYNAPARCPESIARILLVSSPLRSSPLPLLTFRFRALFKVLAVRFLPSISLHVRKKSELFTTVLNNLNEFAIATNFS